MHQMQFDKDRNSKKTNPLPGCLPYFAFKIRDTSASDIKRMIAHPRAITKAKPTITSKNHRNILQAKDLTA